MKEDLEFYRYRIDGNDIIRQVSRNWQKFLDQNDGPSNLAERNIVGKSIWDYISGKETIQLYKIVFEKVRRNQKELKIPFRCDSPDIKRYLTLSLIPAPGNGIDFVSRIIKTEKRASVELLRNDIKRSKEMINMCSMCKKIRISGNRWEEIETAIDELNLFHGRVLPEISHGICPACFADVMKNIGQLE